MDIEGAKENIQPMAAGRNATILQASLTESHSELMEQRKKLEKEIHDYAGDDPLEAWYNYICWIEQSFPSGGKESGLMEVLSKCLLHFEEVAYYHQDRRLIKLFIKFMDTHKDPAECYQQLFNAGFGTMVADFYISWAYYYNINGNTQKADETFRRGIDCRAQPIEEIEDAYHQFCFYIAQRSMYEEGTSSREVATKELEERRIALTSLRSYHRRGEVGSIRTGAAVKKYVPGVVKNEGETTKGNSRQMKIFSDENADPAPLPPTIVATEGDVPKSVVRTIIDAMRNEENCKEPGPWNKANDKHKSGKLFSNVDKKHDLCFDIHEDNAISEGLDTYTEPLRDPIVAEITNVNEPFRYPRNFAKKNHPQPRWWTPVTYENEPEKGTFPMYNKCMLYPRPNMELQLEELLAYYWYKKRDISNHFTQERDRVWSKGDVDANMRQYPNFAKRSLLQELDELDWPYVPEKIPNMVVNFGLLYNESGEEFQFEELMQRNRKKNQTIISSSDIEETICDPMELINRRKSFFPFRKSVAPTAMPDDSTMATRRHISEIKIASEGDFALGAKAAEERDAHKESDQPSYSRYNDSKSSATNDFDTTKQMLMRSSLKDSSVSVVSAPKVAEPSSQQQSTLSHGSKHALPPIRLPSNSVQSDELSLSTHKLTSLPPSTSQRMFQAQTNEDSLFQMDDGASAKGFAVPSVPEEFPKPPQKSIECEVDKENVYVDAESFVFKPPVLAPKDSKMPFEIFTEEVTAQGVPAVVNSGGYDADETCSTQTFNLFLKTQSVSTPKSGHIPPARQFGNVLREIGGAARALEPIVPEEQEVSPISAPPMMAATAAFSPLQAKQLSTILETSEHGTTQGTHSTGGSTKSTFSPTEIESEARDRDGAVRTKLPYGDLETLAEQSQELSSENGKITASADAETKKDAFMPVPATPDAMRLQQGHCWPVLGVQRAGDFTHLEQREDTATDYITRPPLFQEDKTETISKMLISSRQGSKFPDEKTETIPNFGHFPKIGDDQTHTTSKVFSVPPTIPCALDASGSDDSFGFFVKTPPKMQRKSLADCPDFEDPLSVSNSAELLHKNVNHRMETAPKAIPKIPVPPPETHSSAYRLSLGKTFLDFSTEYFPMGPAHKPKDDFGGPAYQPSFSTNNDFKENAPVNYLDVPKHKFMESFIKDFSASANHPTTSMGASTQSKSAANFFELNAETAMFSTDISMIKNSTLLPEKPPLDALNITDVFPSLDKSAQPSLMQCTSPAPAASCSSAPIRKPLEQKVQSFCKEATMDCSSSYSGILPGAHEQTPLGAGKTKQLRATNDSFDQEAPPTPNNTYVHPVVCLDETHRLIEHSYINTAVNPFCLSLKTAFLDNIDFTNFINDLPTCTLLGHVTRMRPGSIVRAGGTSFEVEKLIGEGSYGVVYAGKESKSGRRYALKQERPPNHWEYYICLEVQSRLKADEMLPAFMSVEYALVGNNASVLISHYAPYGSLVTVVNSIRQKTSKNIDEYIVMYLACELLDIIDHLHAINIIHADLKPDNFLLISKLKYGSDQRSLQLIDFGVSIDMKLFKGSQTFTYVNKDNSFKCVEMFENRPWTYQYDLFGLAWVIHTLLFGKHMELAKRANGSWMHKTSVPRYFNRDLWETIFRSLLNVSDCNSLPNLQHLRSVLKECIVEKEKYVLNKIADFNSILGH